MALGDSAEWTDAQAGIPSSVDLAAVTTTGSGSSEVVIAVGRDAGTGRAVIYRDAGGVWQRDAIQSLPSQSDSCLRSVAVDNGPPATDQSAVWAAGSQGGGCPGDQAGSGTAFLVRLSGTAVGQSTAANWDSVAANLGGPALSVSLSGGTGYLAVGSQGVYSFSDGPSPSFTAVSFGASAGGLTPAPAPTAVNAVAAYGQATAYGVGAQANSEDVFAISGTSGSDAPLASASAPSQGLTRVAALSSKQAIAIDGQGNDGWWFTDPTTGVWTRDKASALDSATLTDVSLGPGASGGPPIVAIAGEDANLYGTIWEQTLGQTGFSQADVSCLPVNGVTVAGPGDMWAVGDGGSVFHFTTSSAPAAVCKPTVPTVITQTSGGSGGSGGGSGSTSSASTANGSGSGSSTSQSGAGSGSGSSPGVQVTVSQPAVGPAPKPTKPSPGHPKPTHKPRLLVHDVRVREENGRLVVTCRLNAPAKVSAVATTSGRVVGRAGWHTFTGHGCQLVVPYQGSDPPKKLRIVALPLSHPSRKQAP